MAELHAGVLAATDTGTRARRLATLDAIAVVEALPVTAGAARQWAMLGVRLAEDGRTAKINDLWIAAVASANGMDVVGHDGDFDAIEGVERPSSSETFIGSPTVDSSSGEASACGMIGAMPSLTEPVVATGRMRALPQPTLTDDRLVIRSWQTDDAAAVFEAYQDPAIQRWHVRSMTNLAEASAWIDSWPDRWQKETGADWAVVADANVVGRVGIKRLDLWDGIAELAYWCYQLLVAATPRLARSERLAFGPSMCWACTDSN